MKSTAAFLLFLVHSVGVLGAAPFVNLDFESSQVTPLPIDSMEVVPTSVAFPGWTALLRGFSQSTVGHNRVSLGTPQIAILGPTTFFGIVQGQFTAVLQSQPDVSVFVGQTGLIPADAKSLRFEAVLGYSSLPVTYPVVSVGGTTLQLVSLGFRGDVRLFGADVSSFAGQEQDLRIGSVSGPSEGLKDLYLDAISFSPDPIPEPSTLALALCGALALGAVGVVDRLRRQSRGRLQSGRVNAEL